MSADLFERMRAVLAERLGVSPDRVTVESSFIDDLGADSLDVIQLGIVLEKEFAVAIPEQEYFQLRTVGDVLRYVEARWNPS